MLLLILVFLAFFIAYIYLQAKKDIFKPIVIAGAIFIFYYLFDLMFSLWDSSKNSNFSLSNSIFGYTNLLGISSLTLICITFWALGDWILSIKKPQIKNSNKTNTVTLKSTFMYSKLKYVRTISTITLIFLLTEILNFYEFIYNFGGLKFYFQHIADRALIFSDHTYFYALIQITTILGAVVAGYLMAIISTKKKSLLLIVITLMIIGSLLVLSVLTGARANILRPIIIMLVIHSYFGKILKINIKLIASILILAILLVGFSQLTRSSDKQNHDNMLESIFNSTEVSQINNVMILNQENLVHSENGKTIISGLLAFIPSNIYDSIGIKKTSGGNAVFTQDVWPARWERAQSEVALGFLGESVMNFGYWLTPLVFFIAGILYRSFYNLLILRKNVGIFGLLSYIGVVWSIFQLLRGDVYNTISTFFIYILASLISYLLIRLTIRIPKKEITDIKNSGLIK